MGRSSEVMVPHLTAGTAAPAIAKADQGLRHMFVRDFVLNCSIGVYRHERDAPQRVRLNLDLAVVDDQAGESDQIDDTVSYEHIVDQARTIVADKHYNLVETLAEALAVMCLADHRVRTARVRVEKLDVFADVAAVGVEIERVP